MPCERMYEGQGVCVNGVGGGLRVGGGRDCLARPKQNSRITRLWPMQLRPGRRLTAGGLLCYLGRGGASRPGECRWVR